MSNVRPITPQTKIPTEDQLLIAAVVEAETQAFVDDDYDAWAKCWAQQDRAQMIAVTSTTGLDIRSGWSEIAEEMQHVMQNGLGCDMVAFENSNHQTHVDGNMAWTTYDQWAKNRSGLVWETLETRILERTDGVWKIVYCSFVDRGRDSSGQGMLAVDASGRLIKPTSELIETLADHPILTVSAGRIRAKRRIWDRELQKAISQAARYHGFYQLRRFEDETGGPFHTPAVLGETVDGGMAIVHVLVRDGTTYLQLDSSRSVERRLCVAQAVFGLSDGQRRVAQHIADGLGPKGAADALGISVNTARTHLTRLYEKTGVNSQAALVRILLSVG